MADVAWLTGFGGSSGLALVGGSRRLFVTDFRYIERASRELPAGFELLRAEYHLIDALAPALEGKIGFDEATTSVKVQGRLSELLPAGAELVPVRDVLAGLRRVKDAAEIAAVAAAAELTDEVYVWLLERGLAGSSERQVALEIEAKMRELGAEDPSFPSIVASGPNGALPHATPGDRLIGPAEMVTIDIGSILDGYCSDCTRTYATGDPGEEQREVYELVREAQQAALGAVRAGADGKAVDAVARERIAAAGHGERFGHGLGHGVGIEVHEAPRLSPRSEDTLLAGDVVTVEPGVYVEGLFGVRIEDLVAVTDDGCRMLSGRPKELTICG
jgi:Xaa-Pro aminopeptidase